MLAVLGISAVLMFIAASRSNATDNAVALDAKVAWANDHFVVITARDSIPFDAGDLVYFFSRDKRVAEGSIQHVFQTKMAVIELSRGSNLKAEKKLDRIRMTAEKRITVPPTSVRLGYPAAGRSNLLFVCDSMISKVPGGYGLERISDHQMRWFRGASTSPLWPDTMIFRLFDDSADEEIAFERGDLDIAMFWPGELSQHARELWPREPHEFTFFKMPGVLAAIRIGSSVPLGTLSDPDWQAMRLLREELFRGDVDSYLWDETETHYPPRRGQTSARFEVDHACPGWQTIERFLNGSRGERAASGDTIHLFYFDNDVHDPRGVALEIAIYIRDGPFPPALKARADSVITELVSAKDPPFDQVRSRLHGSLQVPVLYGLQCRLLYSPRLDAFVRAVGNKWAVNLLDCARTGRRP